MCTSDNILCPKNTKITLKGCKRYKKIIFNFCHHSYQRNVHVFFLFRHSTCDANKVSMYMDVNMLLHHTYTCNPCKMVYTHSNLSTLYTHNTHIHVQCKRSKIRLDPNFPLYGKCSWLFYTKATYFEVILKFGGGSVT